MKTGILRFKVLPDYLDMLGMPNDIPIQEGGHAYELDVREDMIDASVIEKVREVSKHNYTQRYGVEPESHILAKPMGFNVAAAEKAGGEIIWDEDINKLNAEVKK